MCYTYIYISHTYTHASEKLSTRVGGAGYIAAVYIALINIIIVIAIIVVDVIALRAKRKGNKRKRIFTRCKYLCAKDG